MAPKIASLFTLALAATSVSGHAFFHTGYVNGKSQGHLFGVRAPQSNSPIQDVTFPAMACNSPLTSPVSKDVIEVAPGDKFGMQWNHNLAGPTAGDGDDPIAASHKGPVIAYMAKVDDASTNDGSGLKWFKVAEEGLDTSTGKWGVDTLIANAGLWSFDMPSLTPGDYLLRGEIIALHSAGSNGGAQFYMSCAAIRVTGSGTCSPSGTASFPDTYSATEPSILISIYGNNGQPDNGGKPYAIPGPSVATCDASSGSPATSKASSSSVKASSAVPLTFKTLTTQRTSASAEVSSTSSTRVSGGEDNNDDGNCTSTVTSVTSVATTARPSNTNIAVPSTTANSITASTPVKGDPGTGSVGTSPATPSYSMTGPGGKKFVCYEVTDF